MSTKDRLSETSPEPTVRRAQRTDILSPDKPLKKLTALEGKPTDPIEHFRRIACEEGHTNWDPKSLVYSIDHRSFLIRCIDCESHYVIPAGSPIPLQVPAGMVPNT